MVKISVIMPVYNCGQYIGQSIQSIQRQTIKDIEIICVDDGSTDYSAGIIRSFQKNDGRITLYSQKNQGAGAARNLGMRHAQGEFIAFLDADDYYLDTDALERMFCTCKERKVSVCGTKIHIEREGKLFKDRAYGKVAEASGHNPVLQYRDFQFDYGYYGFIFERKLLIENRIQFPLYRRFQDPVFFVRVMYAAGQFCFIDKALYAYRAPNALSRFHKGNTVDLLQGLLDNLEFAAEHNLKKLFLNTIKRVEEEYTEIICQNLSVESLSILIKMNRVIRGNGSCSAEYVITPLQKVLESVRASENLHKQILADKLEACERIYLYGAGKVCIDFLQYLREHGWIQKVCSVLVTSLGDNLDMIQGIPVMEAADYQTQKGDLVVNTVSGIYRKEVCAILKEKGIIDYEIVC